MNGNFRESATGEIDLEDEEPEIVNHMIDFFYTGDYNDSRGSDPIIIDAISPVQDVESPLIDPYYLVTSSSSTPATPSSSSNLTAFGTAEFEDPAPSPLIYLDDESTSLTGGSTNGSSGSSSSPTPSDSASTSLFDSPLMNNSFNNSARAGALLINAKVYILAEKYDIQPLKLYSTQKYKSLLPGTMSSSCFVESLEMIYDGTPDRVGAQELLREIVINAASERAKDLLEREDFFMLCKDRGDIATDFLLNSGKYADLTIRCGTTTFRLHCAIVCTRSPVIAAAVDGQFMEAAMRDIDYSIEELPILNAMINYLYMGDYDDQVGNEGQAYEDTLPPSSSTRSSISRNREVNPTQFDPYDMPGDPPPAEEPQAEVEVMGERKVFEAEKLEDKASALLFNTKVYIIADKYDIPVLKTLAKAKYERSIISHWNTPTFSEAAKLLWENTMDDDRLLRNVVIDAATANLDDLLDRGEFKELLVWDGQFGLDIFLTTTSTPTHPSLIFNTKWYITADKYDIPALKVQAVTKYTISLPLRLNNPQFAKAIDTLWENTMDADKELRDVMTVAGCRHISSLLDRGYFVHLPTDRGDLEGGLSKDPYRWALDRGTETRNTKVLWIFITMVIPTAEEEIYE
ncbi:hypothetical protein B7494_g4422 [Chlorociboria aeruginascens]|nr:hypothetical protein B7494_g4422 [Chlorociboria aeruginascens]